MKVNKTAQPRVELITDGVPMLIIDDFYENPDEVREMALDREFRDTKAGYPGRHEYLNPGDREVGDMLRHVQQIVQVGSGLKIEFAQLSTDFSILTTPKEKVLKSQSHPHTDGVSLAGLVYLNKKKYGGTCFYQNTALSSAVLVQSNQSAYDDLMKDYDKNFAEVEGYVSDSFDMWKLIHRTDGTYNQFVMYPGNVFHSVDVVENPNPNEPKLARLTQRLFVGEIDRN